MLGIGVAEHAGFIDTSIRALLNVTAKWLLTPMVIIVGIVSHAAVDAGYVLVIPLGGVIFYAAGRHPLAGIAAAFAGVSGGFSANFVPSSLDPLLQGLTQEGARLLDPDIAVNTLNNYFFTTASSILIVALGWWLTDRVVEPRLQGNGRLAQELVEELLVRIERAHGLLDGRARPLREIELRLKRLGLAGPGLGRGLGVGGAIGCRRLRGRCLLDPGRNLGLLLRRAPPTQRQRAQ